MPDPNFDAVDLARHQRWLDRAGGTRTRLMVFDGAGVPRWGGDQPAAAALGQVIASAATNAPGMHRHDTDDGSTALYQTLGDTKDGPLGWAAVVTDYGGERGPTIDMDRMTAIVDDLATGIADEYRHKADMEMMTEELGARYEELHLVYAVDQHVKSHAWNNETVFQSLLQAAVEHLTVDVIAFVRPSKQICLHAIAPGTAVHNLDLVLVEMRGDLYRFLQAAAETIVINSMDDPRRSYIFTNMPYKILACPVKTEKHVDALLVLLNHNHKPDFSNSDRKLADVLANQLSSLSNTCQLLENMRAFSEQLAMTLIEAVEAKDPYTRGHSERVNFLAMEIGKAMGLACDDLDDLRWASLLHDVGKIGIPDAVLCKPSQLTRDEYTFIMVHPERSYEILRHIKHLEKAALGARHHQEMFDGKGYPHGLKGERIPLHARIIAVPDTYDSITSSRAYRAGRSHEVAMEEIRRVSGSQLDPAIVEVFEHVVAAEPEWLKRFNIRRETS